MQELSDEQALIREYLLGNLGQAQMEQLETRLLSDDEFAERLYATEDNLIDDYVIGALSEREEEKFKADFILTEKRRKKILISQALRSYVSMTYPPAPNESSHIGPNFLMRTLQSLRRHKAPALISLAVVLLMVFVAPKVVKLLKENDHLAALQTQRAKIERQIAELNRYPLDTLTEEHNTLELVLQPTVLREGGEMKKAVITKDVKVLSLKLAVRPRRYESYHALVLTDDDKELFAVSDLTTDVDAAVILLKIPAELLPTGDYQVALSGPATDGRTEDLGRYYFRIIKERLWSPDH